MSIYKKPLLYYISLRIFIFLRTYFFLPNFDSKDASYQERFPKNFKQFDSLIDKIYYNLQETENVFINQAKAVADRDVELINQIVTVFRMFLLGAKIVLMNLNNPSEQWANNVLCFQLESLQECLKEKQKTYENIDQSVQFIGNLNNDLQNIVAKLEKELGSSPHLVNGLKFSPDRTQM